MKVTKQNHRFLTPETPKRLLLTTSSKGRYPQSVTDFFVSTESADSDVTLTCSRHRATRNHSRVGIAPEPLSFDSNRLAPAEEVPRDMHSLQMQ